MLAGPSLPFSGDWCVLTLFCLTLHRPEAFPLLRQIEDPPRIIEKAESPPRSHVPRTFNNISWEPQPKARQPSGFYSGHIREPHAWRLHARGA